MIEFIHTEDGDWTIVKVDGKVFTEGHSISNWDIIELLQRLGHEATQKEITQNQYDEGDY